MASDNLVCIRRYKIHCKGRLSRSDWSTSNIYAVSEDWAKCVAAHFYSALYGEPEIAAAVAKQITESKLVDVAEAKCTFLDLKMMVSKANSSNTMGMMLLIHKFCTNDAKLRSESDTFFY